MDIPFLKLTLVILFPVGVTVPIRIQQLSLLDPANSMSQLRTVTLKAGSLIIVLQMFFKKSLGQSLPLHRPICSASVLFIITYGGLLWGAVFLGPLAPLRGI
jgi:hypothetical protein